VSQLGGIQNAVCPKPPFLAQIPQPLLYYKETALVTPSAFPKSCRDKSSSLSPLDLWVSVTT
jgi:hypothetical protein